MQRFLLVLLGLGALSTALAFAQRHAGPKHRRAGEGGKGHGRADGGSGRDLGQQDRNHLINSPANVNVLTADTIASSPAQNYGDLLTTIVGGPILYEGK